MANWNNPALTSLYVDFLAELKARDVDVAIMSFAGGATNIPLNTIRFERTTAVFQEWLGPVLGWQNKIIGPAGGGTGTTSIALGTMASQNSNAVAITGGTISGTALNGSDISSGIVALARGGTGASLALAAAGNFLLSNGAQVIFGVDASALQSLNASQLLFGQIPMARMPTGGTWNLTSLVEISTTSYIRIATPSGFIVGGGLAAMGAGFINAAGYYINNVPFVPGSGVPSGMMAYFGGGCPAGWTFVAGSQGRTIRSQPGGGGGTGGSDTHHHGFSVPAGGGGGINSGPAIGETSGQRSAAVTFRNFDSGSSFSGFLLNDSFTHDHTIGHTHNFNVPGFPGHNGDTGEGDSWPPFIDFTLCQKN